MFTGVRVLLLGDVMLDKYVYGNIARISPEAPVPILQHTEEKNMLGGAGNVFRNLIALSGKRHVLLSVAGEDEYQIQMQKILSDMAKYHLFIDPERKTTFKMRLTAQGQQVIRYDIETTSPLKAELREKILYTYKEQLESCDVVVLSDYNKGFFCGDFTQEVIQLAVKMGKPVLVDPKNSDYSVYTGADFVKPNRKELSEASGLSVQSLYDITAAARSLCRKHSIGNIIVTLSEDGMVYVPGNGGNVIHKEVEYIPEVFDVSGAGDTVLAVLALSIGCGIEISWALNIATIAAQIAISKSGTAVVTPEEIIHYVYSHNTEVSTGNLLNKIVTLPQAKQIVKAWKNSGKEVCFTNGCFDLLHYGHISSFLQAKEHGDRLIVAMNSDKSVKKNKGSQRPVQDEKTRASLLAVLQCVDLVIAFDEDTPLHLVRELHPDVIAKEGYALENWAEARFVQSYGGKVVFLKREDGYSTSDLVGKIAMIRELA